MASTDSPILYTALGNCQAAGAGGPLLITIGYVRQYRRMMERTLERRIRLANYSYLFGLYVRDLWRQLQCDRRLIRNLEQSGIVTFNIGENELLWADRLYRCGDTQAADWVVEEFAHFYPRVINRLLELVPPGQAIIRTFNIYNPLPDHPLADRLRAFNNVIRRSTAAGRNAHRRRISMADIYGIFHDGPLHDYVGPDGKHLSYLGHRRIALALADLGTDPV